MPGKESEGGSTMTKVATVVAVVALLISLSTAVYVFTQEEETKTIYTGGEDSDNDGVIDSQDEWPGYDDAKFSSKAVTVGLVQEPKTMHPITQPDIYSFIPLQGIFEPVIRTNPNGKPNAGGKAIAKEFSQSEDGLTYTFQLEKNVTFHNGEKCTAEDVVFTLKTMRSNEEPISPRRQAFTVMESVEATGEYEVTVKLNEVDTTFLTVAMPNALVVPKDYIQDNGWDQFIEEKIGTGPYKFKSYTPGNEIILTRNEDYRGRPAYIKNVRFKIYPERSTGVMALRTGDAHYMRAIPAEQWESLKAPPTVTPRSYQSLSFTFLQFNTTREPFGNKKVRKALAYAVDVGQVITASTSPELAANDRSPIPAMMPAHADVNQYKQDIEKAKQLMDEAGYDEINTKIYCVPGPRVTAAQVIASHAEKIGINIDIVKEEWGMYIDDVRSGTADLWLSGWISEGSDPGGLINYFTSDSQWNWYCGQYHNESFDQTFKEAVKTPDAEKRTELYKEAQRILVNDMGMLNLWVSKAAVANHESLRIPETSYNPFMFVGPLNQMHNWYFEEE